MKPCRPSSAAGRQSHSKGTTATSARHASRLGASGVARYLASRRWGAAKKTWPAMIGKGAVAAIRRPATSGSAAVLFWPTTCGSSSAGLWRIRRSMLHNTMPSKSSKVVEGYQSIGSFHSENLEDLMKLSNETYVPPELPFPDDKCDDPSSEEAEGSSRSDFLLDPSWTFLNHGAFGAALRVGHHRANQWRTFLEAQPLRYFDRYLLPHLARSARLLADFVQAPRTDVALLPNVTSGLNSVLSGYARHYRHIPQLNVILWDTSYGSVKHMVQWYFSPNSNIHEIPFQSQHFHRFATSSHPEAVLEELMLEVVEKCRHHRTLLLLDHTSSNTALTFPIAQLAKAAKQHHNELDVIVDGAHGLLAQELDIQHTLVPHMDAYVTNGHKWFAAPRGIAMLYAKPHWHHTVLQQPIMVSHGSHAPDLFSRYVWDGCRDYAAALSIPAVHRYWTVHRDPTQIRHQLRQQLQQGIALLANHWHSSSGNAEDPSTWPGRVTVAPFSSLLSPMALVALPRQSSSSSVGQQFTSIDAKKLQDALYDRKIEVPIKCINGTLYVRLSCHVYNTLDDFDRLGRAVTTLGLPAG